jgi:16S rRNA (guanine527-N7)-methyltransferase
MFEAFVNTFPNTSVETLLKIETYYSLLVKWNKSLNLVQKDTLTREIFEKRHLIDCWQLISYLHKERRVLDVGSGAGLPGILLSIAGFDVDLAEQDMNKVSFLKNCKSLLRLNCTILPIDIFSVNQTYNQMTSRAFLQMDVLLQIQSIVSRETKGAFLKGANYSAELEGARKIWNFDATINDSLSSREGKIVIISNLSKK